MRATSRSKGSRAVGRSSVGAVRSGGRAADGGPLGSGVAASSGIDAPPAISESGTWRTAPVKVSSTTRKDKTTGCTDQSWWKRRRATEANSKTQEWIQHDDTITLVNTNPEALNIGANYAIKRAKELGAILWQWAAKNAVCPDSVHTVLYTRRARCTTSNAARAPMNEVQNLRNYLGVFEGMQVMLLKNM